MRLSIVLCLCTSVCCTGAFGDLVKVYDFLDYGNASRKDVGFLTLKQDAENPLILPQQYTLCARVHKWYERTKYTTFGTISLLDKDGNVTNQFFHGMSWWGRFWLSEYHTTGRIKRANRRTKLTVVDKPFETNEWSHVCYSVDFLNGTLKVFFDGNRVMRNHPDMEVTNATELYSKLWTGPEDKYHYTNTRGNRVEENQRFELMIGIHRSLPQIT